ncbi:unnamed protein product [Rangifer tarandus platyrhynchus]|uniref:Uncharacterized protein n=1 Tax=Rangifer tarandus platyrhynchus TaxID=3082113 RepID=A0AC59YIU3_RANTA
MGEPAPAHLDLRPTAAVTRVQRQRLCNWDILSSHGRWDGGVRAMTSTPDPSVGTRGIMALVQQSLRFWSPSSAHDQLAPRQR